MIKMIKGVPIKETNRTDLFTITVSDRVMRDIIMFRDRFAPGAFVYLTFMIDRNGKPLGFGIGAGPKRYPRSVEGRGGPPPIETVIDGVEVRLIGCPEFATLEHMHLDYVDGKIQNIE